MITIELCVEGLASAVAAGQGGADRIELCECMPVGGVSPEGGTIASACERLPVPIHVLVRPRAGDFDYSAAEFETMRFEVEQAGNLGASGVVFGLLRSDGEIDEDRTAALVDLARPMSVTFHRAFDESPDPLRSLDVLIALGVNRVLTSGRAATARDGREVLSSLVSRAMGRIAVMAGGRISQADIPGLVSAGLRKLHIGSAACRDGGTDADAVRRLVAVARSLDRTG